jgi:ABC-type transporter Mla subunit MlaD
MGSLSQQVELLLAQSTESNRSLQDVVSKLTASTEKAISGLNQGAETLYVAASDFARAGDGVSETMRSAVAAVAEIKATSATLSSAAISVKEVLADYSRTRDSFNALVVELNSIIDLTKRDASMTSDIIRRIEAAAEQLAAAQNQSEDYLLGINNVLVKAHEAFAENVERTLRESNKQFQRELGDAVNLVSAAVKELGDTLDELPSKV